MSRGSWWRRSRLQTIQAKLANLSTEIEATRLLVHKTACLKDAGQNFTPC